VSPARPAPTRLGLEPGNAPRARLAPAESGKVTPRAAPRPTASARRAVLLLATAGRRRARRADASARTARQAPTSLRLELGHARPARQQCAASGSKRRVVASPATPSAQRVLGRVPRDRPRRRLRDAAVSPVRQGPTRRRLELMHAPCSRRRPAVSGRVVPRAAAPLTACVSATPGTRAHTEPSARRAPPASSRARQMRV